MRRRIWTTEKGDAHKYIYMYTVYKIVYIYILYTYKKNIIIIIQ